MPTVSSRPFLLVGSLAHRPSATLNNIGGMHVSWFSYCRSVCFNLPACLQRENSGGLRDDVRPHRDPNQRTGQIFILVDQNLNTSKRKKKRKREKGKRIVECESYLLMLSSRRIVQPPGQVHHNWVQWPPGSAVGNGLGTTGRVSATL